MVHDDNDGYDDDDDCDEDDACKSREGKRQGQGKGGWSYSNFHLQFYTTNVK